MPDPKPVESLTEAEATAELTRLADELAAHDVRYFQDEAPDRKSTRLNSSHSS